MFRKVGTLFDSEIQAGTVLGAYCVRIEDSAIARSIAHKYSTAPIYITPAEDSGRAWWQFVYDELLDREIQDAVDALAGIRFSRPNYGQMSFLEERDA